MGAPMPGNLGSLFGNQMPMQGTAQSALGGNQMLQPMTQQYLGQPLATNLRGLFGNVQNATQAPPGGLASLVPQHPQTTGLSHYGPGAQR
jgi:hypothetical protein